MNTKYKPEDLSKIHTYSAETRTTKVTLSNFAKVCNPQADVGQFLDSLPKSLKADDLRAVVKAIVSAYRTSKPVVVGIGGHVIKTGLSPLLIELMQRKIITAIIMNGGASIHDFEIATNGTTSEDVASNLENGMFGMVQETPSLMNKAFKTGALSGFGMGYSLGKMLLESAYSYVDYSILAIGARLNIPVTVHISIGGDTIHMHPSTDGASLGETSYTDFRILVSVLKDLGNGGVYLNIGSAVVLPEVFLKALNLARNLSDERIVGFTTVNMDMQQHYRPLENVVGRPTKSGGKGYALTGHHEIMVPLLTSLVLHEIHQDG